MLGEKKAYKFFCKHVKDIQDLPFLNKTKQNNTKKTLSWLSSDVKAQATLPVYSHNDNVQPGTNCPRECLMATNDSALKHTQACILNKDPILSRVIKIRVILHSGT